MNFAIDRTLFTAIQFQTMDYCNRRCSFCPNIDDIRKTKERMSEEILHKILEDLSSIGFKGRVSPYLFNEPLLDSNIFSVVSMIRQKLPENVIFMNSNGDALFRKGMSVPFANCEMDGVHINCYGNENNYRRMMRLVEQLSTEYPRIRIWNAGSLRKLKNRNGYLNVRVFWIPVAKSNFWNRGGNVDAVAPADKGNERFVCEYPFQQMYLTHRGDAILCCSDWKFSVRMGNVMQSSLWEIWNGPLYRRYREMHLTLRGKELPLCRTCNLILSPPENSVNHG